MKIEKILKISVFRTKKFMDFLEDRYFFALKLFAKIGEIEKIKIIY